MTIDPAWVALHLYSEHDLDDVLASVVRPAVRRLERTRTLRRFFFIRYWDKGAHVRLRLLAAADGAGGLRERAARLVAARARAARIELTVVDRPYPPEIERYGGVRGLEITEAQFHLSSAAVLEVIADGASPAQRTGCAGWMLLALVAVCGLGGEQAASFLAALRERWTLAAFAGGEGRLSQPVGEVLRRRLGIEIERARETGTFELLTAAWRRLESDGSRRAPAVDPRLSRWLRGTRGQVAELCTAAEDGGLDSIPRHRWPRPPQPPPRCAPVAGIVWDWAHLTNNRLGLTNPDEVLVGHLTAVVVAEAARSASHGRH